ncbi:MAG: HlyD family efflux transporter periplasmic adaptor subunit [Planctomycetota bacterium]
MSPIASPPESSVPDESSSVANHPATTESGPHSPTNVESDMVSPQSDQPNMPPSGSGRTPKRLIAGAVSLIGLVLVAAAVNHLRNSGGPAAEEGRVNAEALPVRTLVVGTVQPPDQSREYAGLLVPEKESTLSFEGAGRIAGVNVNEGDRVRAGEVLAILDQTHLDAKQQRIESELSAAKAKLKELVAGPRKQTVDAARARVDELAARVELAKVEARRQEELVPRGATSRSERDTAVFGLQADSSSLLAAKAVLSELAEGTRSEQIEEQRARCGSIEASLKELDAERSDATLRAPFDGLIEQRLVDEGTVVSAGVPVLGLVSDRVEAEVGLPPAVAGKLQPGHPVTLTLRNETRVARIRRIEPTVRRRERTRVVFASFQENARNQSMVDSIGPPGNPVDGEWVAGEVIGLSGVCGEQDESNSQFWLPSTALARGTRGLWTVMTLVPANEELLSEPRGVTVCENRSVELLRTDGSYVLVRGMLANGEAVIAEGLHRLTAGMPVRPVTASADSAEDSEDE